jgi:ferritin-like metal-binding protein YciE
MAEKSLHDLFIEELKDIYDGEKRLTRALPKMAKAATSMELRSAFTSHLGETEKQIERLEQVFQAMGKKPAGKACDGIIGIVEEGNKAMEELDEGPILDAALIAGAQKVEHYEMATYGTLAYFADIMGHEEAKDLLGQTLDEEKAADAKLNKIAKSEVNQEALRGTHHYDNESGVFDMARSGLRRAGAAVGRANERATRTRTASRARRSSSSTSANRRRSTGRSTKKR